MLVRHGRPRQTRAGALDSTAYTAWRSAYDANGLAAGETAPADLREMAARAGIVVASDLPRAAASARLLAGDGLVATSPLLREPFPPVPALGSARLPLRVWRVLGAAAWGLDLLPVAEPPAAARARAAEAARWLDDLAEEHGSVLAVTHSRFRRLTARALRTLGWRLRGWPGRSYWSAWTLARTPDHRTTR